MECHTQSRNSLILTVFDSWAQGLEPWWSRGIYLEDGMYMDRWEQCGLCVSSGFNRYNFSNWGDNRFSSSSSSLHQLPTSDASEIKKESYRTNLSNFHMLKPQKPSMAGFAGPGACLPANHRSEDSLIHSYGVTTAVHNLPCIHVYSL